MDSREAVSGGESSRNGPALASDARESPLPYTETIGMHPKSFYIRGALLYTSSGASYQLSSALDQSGQTLLLRTLSPKESIQAATPAAPALPFNKASVLYEIFWAPLNTNWLEIRGRRRHGVPGSVRLKHGFRTWRVVQHAPGGKTEDKDIITVKRYSPRPGNSRLGWRVVGGDIIAYEDKDATGEHEYQPILKLTRDLDDNLIEFLIACWVGRLWFKASLGKTRRKRLWPRKKMRAILPKLNVFRKVSTAFREAKRDEMVKSYLDCAPVI